MYWRIYEARGGFNGATSEQTPRIFSQLSVCGMTYESLGWTTRRLLPLTMDSVPLGPLLPIDLVMLLPLLKFERKEAEAWHYIAE